VPGNWRHQIPWASPEPSIASHSESTMSPVSPGGTSHSKTPKKKTKPFFKVLNNRTGDSGDSGDIGEKKRVILSPLCHQYRDLVVTQSLQPIHGHSNQALADDTARSAAHHRAADNDPTG